MWRVLSQRKIEPIPLLLFPCYCKVWFWRSPWLESSINTVNFQGIKGTLTNHGGNANEVSLENISLRYLYYVAGYSIRSTVAELSSNRTAGNHGLQVSTERNKKNTVMCSRFQQSLELGHFTLNAPPPTPTDRSNGRKQEGRRDNWYKYHTAQERV